MWFNLDMTLAQVHKEILSKYLYMTKDYDGQEMTYEELLGLTQDDPEAVMRREHLDIEHTSLPYLINIINPYNSFNTKCRVCG